MTDDNLPAGPLSVFASDQLNRRIGALGMARPQTHRIQLAGRRLPPPASATNADRLASNHRMPQPLRGLQRLPDVAAVRARGSEVLSRLDAGEL